MFQYIGVVGQDGEFPLGEGAGDGKRSIICFTKRERNFVRKIIYNKVYSFGKYNSCNDMMIKDGFDIANYFGFFCVILHI